MISGLGDRDHLDDADDRLTVTTCSGQMIIHDN